MADTEQADRKRAGRPRITDHLDVYFFVEKARRKRGLSVRELTRDRNFVFGGEVTLFSLERSAPVRPLRKETLRRRYREARDLLGLTELPTWCLSSTAHEEVQREARRFLEEMMAEFPD